MNATPDLPATPIRRRRRTDLDQDEVVQAALRIVSNGGVGALTMRRLAEELGLSSMASYYHVPSKSQLFDLVCDAVLATLPSPSTNLSWDDALREQLTAARRELAAHPGVAGLLLGLTTHTPHSRRLDAELNALLQRAGLTAEEAISMGRAMIIYLFGRVSYDENVPLTGRKTAQEEFLVGLDLMLTGIEQRIGTRRSA
jgi:AcrR family transcriptional regulator